MRISILFHITKLWFNCLMFNINAVCYRQWCVAFIVFINAYQFSLEFFFLLNRWQIENWSHSISMEKWIYWNLIINDLLIVLATKTARISHIYRLRINGSHVMFTSKHCHCSTKTIFFFSFSFLRFAIAT